MTELPEGIAKGIHEAENGASTDWTEEQILDEIIALAKFAERFASDSDDANKRTALLHTSKRLGSLYQEVGKKMLCLKV